MTDTPHTSPEVRQKPARRLWPWAITSAVALLAALFLTVWVPQEQGEDLLARIKAAGGDYSINESARPEAGSFLDDIEYVELFDRVDRLFLPDSRVDSELFRDSVAAFTSLEELYFDLSNSPDFDREAASRLTELKVVFVTASPEPDTIDYEFLAGCANVEHLDLEGEFHNDGFWQYLPEMRSLTRLDIAEAENVCGEGIPDLSRSNLEVLEIYGTPHSGPPMLRDLTSTPRRHIEPCEFHDFPSLLTAPRLRELTIKWIAVDNTAPGLIGSAPALEVLHLESAKATDRILPTLSQCTSLRVLYLDNNQLTGESLDLLASLPLAILVLDRNPLGEAAFRHLSQFDTLKDLHLSLVDVQPQWLACWKDSPLSRSLEVLTLKYDGGDEVIDLLMSFPKLEELTIYPGDQYPADQAEAAILKLADHPTLKSLTVPTRASPELIKQFRKKVKEQGRTYPEIFH